MKLEEVLPALREGKSIRRGEHVIVPPADFALHAVEIFSEDWEVVKPIIKDCPWCEPPTTIVIDFVRPQYNFEPYVILKCLHCGGSGPASKDEATARYSWNKRREHETHEG